MSSRLSSKSVALLLNNEATPVKGRKPNNTNLICNCWWTQTSLGVVSYPRRILRSMSMFKMSLDVILCPYLHIQLTFLLTDPIQTKGNNQVTISNTKTRTISKFPYPIEKQGKQPSYNIRYNNKGNNQVKRSNRKTRKQPS